MRSITPIGLFFSLLVVILFGASGELRAQIGGPPLAPGPSATYDADVSTMIASGCGYDAWSGSPHREVIDFEVPGAVSEHGLKWTRSFNGGTKWSFAYTWRYVGRPFGYMEYPDGRSAAWAHTNDTPGPLPSGDRLPGTRDRVVTTSDDGKNYADAYDVVLEDGSDLYSSCFTDTYPGDGTPHYIDYAIPQRIKDRYGRVTTLDWEQFKNTGAVDDMNFIHLVKVTDPSGRWIQIVYGDPTSNINPTLVYGSDGQWVKYNYGNQTYTAPDGNHTVYVLTSADYSDGSRATYQYGYVSSVISTTDSANNPIQKTVYGTTLYTADDPHFAGPMHSIKYDWINTTAPDQKGGVSAERDLSSNTVVSSCDNTILKKDSTGTRIETRGDGGTRKIVMKTGEGATTKPGTGAPVVISKQDFSYDGTSSTAETYQYNYASASRPPPPNPSATPSASATPTPFPGNPNWLTEVTDRNGNTTHFDLESIIGHITQVIYPVTSSGTPAATKQYQYGEPNDPIFKAGGYNPLMTEDPHNPYYVTGFTDENGHQTTYTRDHTVVSNQGFSSATHLITQVGYPDGGVETFTYNSSGQVTTHQRKNGAYEYATYDTSGLLTGLWNPTADATYASSNDAHMTYTYYGAGPWQDRLQTVTDPRGYRTTYSYDQPTTCASANDINNNPLPCHSRGMVMSISYPDDTHNGIYPNGTSKSFTYDQYGNKLTETDELGHTTTYTFDNFNRETSVTLPSTDNIPNPPPTLYDYTIKNPNTGASSSYFHATKSVTLETSPMGIKTARTFDANLRMTSKTDGANDNSVAATTTYVYDHNGNETSVTDPRQNTTTFVYDARNRKTSAVDPLKQVTAWAYDAANNVTSTTRPDKSMETKTYDSMNRVLTDVVPRNSATDTLTTIFVYNPSGTLQSVQDAKGQKTTFQYNSADQKIQMYYPKDSSGNSDPNNYQAWSYDPNHNLIARQTANGISQLFSYDARNRQFAMAWSNSLDWASFAYDAAGRMTSVQNPNSIIIRGYDQANRLISDQQQLQIQPITAVSRKTHGSAGTFDVALPLTGAPGVECRLGQGPNSDQHQIIVTFPRPITYGGIAITSGTASVANANLSSDHTQLTINLAGVANAQTVTLTIGSVTDGTVTNDVNIGMGVLVGDTNGDGFVNSADIGQTKSQSGDPVTTSNFREDVNCDGFFNSADIGLVKSKSGTALASSITLTQPGPSNPAITVQYKYDADGKDVRLYAASSGAGTGGYDYTFGYDGMGRFSTISATGAGQLFQYQYDLASNETHRTNNVTSVDQDYGVADALNRITQRDVKVSSNVLSHEVYSYDAMNRLTLVDRTENSAEAGDMFGYDMCGELTGAQYGLKDNTGSATNLIGGVGSSGPTSTVSAASWTNPQRTVSYVWDNAGNRSSMSDSVNGSCTYGTTSLNQYWTDGTNGGTMTNGSEHELANYQNISYKYLNDTHLIAVTDTQAHSYQLYYDAFGRCVVRILNGTTTYYTYDGDKSILEYRSWSQPFASNLYGRKIDEILIRNDSSAPATHQPYYYQDDHEGSITQVTDSFGNVIESYRYDAFGKPTINGGGSASSLDNRFMFTGREYVSQFGIYEYRNRAYHPGLGRFMSEDSKGFATGDYNLFRYCHNDPEDLTDPMGLDPNGGPHNYPVHDLPPDVEQRQQAYIARLNQSYTSGLAGFDSHDAMSAQAATVTGQNMGPTVHFAGAPMGNKNDANAPAGLKIIDQKGRDYYLQPTNSAGNLLKGEIASREMITEKKDQVYDAKGRKIAVESETSEKKGFIYRSDGLIKDRVSTPHVPAHANGEYVKEQRYQIWFRTPGGYGFRYDIQGGFVQIHSFNDGVGSSRLMPIP